MSNVITAAFPFEQTAGDRWVVHMDGTDVVVLTKGEAEVLAAVPVEHAMIYTDAPRRPHRERVQRMVAVAKQYGLYKMKAIRDLDAWLRKQEA
jgi:hypothetical protein